MQLINMIMIYYRDKNPTTTTTKKVKKQTTKKRLRVLEPDVITKNIDLMSLP